MFNYYATVSVSGSTFSGNHANDGGGMGNYYSTPTVTDCTFSGNTAGLHGGGLYYAFTADGVVGTSPTVTRCTFSGNSAEAGGGLFVNAATSAAVTNCVFSGNAAVPNSITTPNPAGPQGGGLYHENSTLAVTNCTFANNTAAVGTGGGVYDASTPASTLTNSILWGNTAPSSPEIFDSNTSLAVTYSVVAGGYTGTGNVSSDPLFVNAATGDLHLGPTSPAIDVGLDSAVPAGVATDRDRLGRFVDGNDADTVATVDMGAYEWRQ